MNIIDIIKRNPFLKSMAYRVLNLNKHYLLVHKKIDNITIFYRIPSYDYTTIKSVFYLSPYEHNEIRIREDYIVFDVGAHIGAFSLYASHKVGENGLVLAFEPDEDNYRILRVNINANNMRNILAFKLALGESIGIKKFVKIVSGYTTGHHILGSSLQPFFKSQPYVVVDVYMTTIDYVTRKLELKDVNYLKIDAEGYEIEVLRGALNTIHRYSPYIIVEASHYPGEEKELGKFFKENTECRIAHSKIVLGEKILFVKCSK